MAELTDLPQYLANVMLASLDAMTAVAYRIKERMAQEGSPIQYPVNWDSPKQRRAFFATKGFGKGIPYKRTHQYRFGWKVERVQMQGARFKLILGNKHPAGAIGGMLSGTQWQSRIHRNRWNYTLNVVWEELAKLPSEVSNNIKAVPQ